LFARRTELDLNRLAGKEFIRLGANIGGRGITWTHSYWGEIATGYISADMSGQNEGWFRIQLGDLDQWIILVARPRHFGGRQWYFMCPVRNRPVSVLWKPNGATRFCSRQPWADKSLTNPNSTTPQIGLMLEKSRSSITADC
jgi:hypothetical protein